MVDNFKSSGNKKSFRQKSSFDKDKELKKRDRIGKRIAMIGIASRREADKLVSDGKVKINGVICNDFSYLVSYEDIIEVNGKEIANKPIRTKIFIFNKPAGYVTTTNDPQGRKNIFELIPSKFGHLITIGRLDFNTNGLLLLTNNGELARIMEMPATGLKRIYFAKVAGDCNQETIKKLENLRNGIKIEGEEYGKMIVEVVENSQVRATLKIVIFEGKNNEIRRIMWHLGLKVVKLTRIQYGDFKLMGLPEGCVQESHLKVDIRELEKRASANIKRYNERKAINAEKEQQVKENKEEQKKNEENSYKKQKNSEIRKDIERDKNNKDDDSEKNNKNEKNNENKKNENTEKNESK